MAMFVFFASIIAAPFARAEEALPLQKARALTLSRSATLRQTELAVDAAFLAARAQGYAALPYITASAGGVYDYSAAASLQNSTTESAQVSASWTVFDGGKTSDLVKKFGFATEAARETLRSTRVSLIGQADSAFFAVLEAAASVEAAVSDLDAAKLRQTIARAKIDAGILSKSAYLQTEADTAGYETTLIVARKTLTSAKAKLASLTGLPAAVALVQIDFSSYAGLLTRLSALDEAAIDKLAIDVTALAKANNPALAGYALSSQQAKMDVEIAQKSYLPTVAAGFSQGLSIGNGSGLTTPGSISLTASLSLDLWNTRNSVEAASIAAAQADLNGNQGDRDLELSAAQALYEWLSSASAISSSSKALDYAESNYDNVLEQFKLSSATTSDLSTAEALVSADQTALITARYGFLSNLSILFGLAGLEDETRLVALIP
jgi:outer membrane protein